MGIQITACRPALERLPDIVGELRYLATPRPEDATSPAVGTLSAFRVAAGHLADVLAPALPGIAPAHAVLPALHDLQAADMHLRADYDRLRDGRTRPMYAEGDVLYQALCIGRDVRDALDEAASDTSARYEGAVEVALEPALHALANAERLADDAWRLDNAELREVADARVTTAEAAVKEAARVWWDNLRTRAALRAVLARRNRSYLLD